MENRSHALAAGLFAVALVVALVVAALWFRGDTKQRTTYQLVTTGSVSGLNPQAPVKLRGVDVGKVGEIRFDPVDPRLILVDIAVDVGTPITAGTYAQLGSQGVTGLAFVQLDDDGKSAKPLESAAGAPVRIAMRPSFLDQVSSGGQAFIGSATEVARRVTNLLDDRNQAQLVRALASVETAGLRVARLAERIEPALHGVPAVVSDVGATIRNADKLVSNLNELSLQVGRKLESVERLTIAADKLGGNADKLGAMTDAVGGKLVNDTLPRFNALVEDVSRAARHVERAAHSLDDQPSSLLFGKLPALPGPGEPGFEPARRGVRP